MDERQRKLERDHDRLLRDINAKFEELLDRMTGAETAADTRMTLFEAKIDAHMKKNDATVAATMNGLAANVNVLVSHILRVDARVDRQDRRITRLEYPEGESDENRTEQ